MDAPRSANYDFWPQRNITGYFDSEITLHRIDETHKHVYWKVRTAIYVLGLTKLKLRCCKN